jgi:hypothetical protein
LSIIHCPLSIALIAAFTCITACQNTSTLPPLPEKVLPFDQWIGQSCDLISDDDLVQILQLNTFDDSLATRSLPNELFCLRTWKKKDWKQREVNNETTGTQYLMTQNRLIVQGQHYGSAESAAQRLAMLRTNRRATYEEDIAGLGDDAIWSTSTVTLLVKKGPVIFQIALEYSDQPHDNLAKAKELAAMILRRTTI